MTNEIKNNFNLTLSKYKFKICPVGVITEESINFFNLYGICKEFNCLPEQGGIFDQENRTIEAFEIITNELAIMENKELKSMENKTKNLSKKGVK